MRSRLDAYGVEMVALSPDTVGEASTLRRMLGLQMTLLSDAELEVIDLYGVRHEGALGAPRNGSLVRPLAIPTTVLIDAEGIVRWLDQTDDYRVRSNPARVLEALEAVLPAPAS